MVPKVTVLDTGSRVTSLEQLSLAESSQQGQSLKMASQFFFDSVELGRNEKIQFPIKSLSI